MMLCDTGMLPSSVPGSLPSLLSLEINNLSLEGPLPHVGGSGHLQHVNLSHLGLSG